MTFVSSIRLMLRHQQLAIAGFALLAAFAVGG
jgi:hypothetical protein